MSSKSFKKLKRKVEQGHLILEQAYPINGEKLHKRLERKQAREAAKHKPDA